jgi:tetratricopeptide (TPR) repeat protein
MKTDLLEELLARTDAALPPPPTSGLLTARVAARVERRQHVRLALTALLAIAITAAAARSFRSHPRLVRQSPSEAPAFNVAQCRRELATMDAEAAMHQRAANEIAALQRRSDALRHARAAALLAPDPLARLEEARDRAARILLIDAARLSAATGRNAAAIEDYRKAVQLFPGTPAAREAAQQLKADGISI